MERCRPVGEPADGTITWTLIDVADEHAALVARGTAGNLFWVTPHSLRRTVATVVRDARGPAQAQQQLSHAKLATTEAHYLQRQTRGPDVRAVLDKYAGGDSGD